ncbi:MAG: hypothetical protein Q9220_007834 [cf. Caloplaca sp. 1 TL-2023]
MSALGSSVINKSGKKFAPKASVRRQTTAIQSQAPASVEISPSAPAIQAQQSQPALRSTSSTPLGSSHTQEDTPANDIAPPQSNNNFKAADLPRSNESTAKDREHIAQSHEVDSIQSPQIIPPDHGPGQPFQIPLPSVHLPKHLSYARSADAGNERAPNLSLNPPAQSSTSLGHFQVTHEAEPNSKRRKTTHGAVSPEPGHQQQPHLRISTTPRLIESNADVVIDKSPVRSSHSRVQSSAPKSKTRTGAAKGQARRKRGAAVANAALTATDTTTQHGTGARQRTHAQQSSGGAVARNDQRLENAAAEIVADAVEISSRRRRGNRGRKPREPTPEEDENATITPGAVRMADLCKDTGKGRKSDTLRALQERDREELMEKKQKELQQLVDEGEHQDPRGLDDTGSISLSRDDDRVPNLNEAERREDVVQHVAGTYVDEYGEIRIDTESLRVDRHARAAAERQQEPDEAVQENDLSRPAVNSMTHTKRERPNSWPEELTDEFYEALRMFGTDFGLISRMLRKTRRAIKLKFTKEEKLDPDRINQALLGAGIAIDLDEYARRAGEEIKETEEHERLMEEDRKMIEENAADELRMKDEQDRLRREEAEREGAAVPEDSSGKENREADNKEKRGKPSRKKKEGRKRKAQAVEEGVQA